MRGFGTFLWPILGIVFLPWTTFLYVLSTNLPLRGLVPVIIMVVIGVITDLGTYFGGAYGNRERFPGRAKG
jgi:hypothetical protein